MGAVLDAADVEHAIVLERAERYTVIAAPRHTPSFEFKSQRLGWPVRVGRQGAGDELNDRRSDFVRQSI
jgi:hypothetical protein